MKLAVSEGDRIESYARYNRVEGKIEYFLANLDTGKYRSVIRHLPEAEFFDGSSAEFIDERPTVAGKPAELANFGQDSWSGAEVKTLSGEWAVLGHVTRLRSRMQRKDETGQVMASPTALGPEGASFTDIWKHCHP